MLEATAPVYPGTGGCAAGMTRADVGVPAALDAGVPLCLVELAKRGLEGDLK